MKLVDLIAPAGFAARRASSSVHRNHPEALARTETESFTRLEGAPRGWTPLQVQILPLTSVPAVQLALAGLVRGLL